MKTCSQPKKNYISSKRYNIYRNIHQTLHQNLTHSMASLSTIRDYIFNRKNKVDTFISWCFGRNHIQNQFTHHNCVQADCKKCYGPGTCAVLQCAANWADSDLDLFLGQFLFGLYHPWRKKLWKFKKSRFNAIYLDLFFGVFWVICFCGSDRMVFLITILHHHLEEYLETQRFPFAS